MNAQLKAAIWTVVLVGSMAVWFLFLYLVIVG
jgi:hypothetical protein